MENMNTRVLKEPRGMIRVIQVIFAILAFSTTSSFDTEITLTVSCVDPKSSAPSSIQRITKYAVEYPFDLSDTKLEYLNSCDGGPESYSSKKLAMDFSSSPRFFVATGVLALLYSAGALVLYILYSPLYESNPVWPIVDLAITGVLSIFWLAAAAAWATGVSDVKHYTSPHHLMKYIPYCEANASNQDVTTDCLPESPGKWSTLYITLIFGFANIFIWAASMWFVYKETAFHQRTLQPQPVGGPGAYPNLGAPGAQMTTVPIDDYGQQQQQPQQQQAYMQQNY